MWPNKLATALAALLLALAATARAQHKIVQRLDSAAAQGTMLQHIDSVARTRLQRPGDDPSKQQRRRQRLAEGDRALFLIDSAMAASYYHKNIDTAYITRPLARWTVKARINTSGSSFRTSGTLSGVEFQSRLEARPRVTLSLAALYRGIGFGVALNPAKFKGESKDFEFNLNSYSNRYGFDVIYQTASTYSGTITSEGRSLNVPKDALSQHTLNLNAYYAFNYRRFSYPAAFSQSYIQRRSAGSWLLAASFEGANIRLHANDQLGTPASIIHAREFAIGAGYGYNLVIRSRWLFHLSALPTFIIYSHDKIKVEDQTRRMKYHLPSAIITSRAAAVYSWQNRFAGLSMVYNASVAGDEQQLEIIRTKWRLRLFYGFRF